MYSYERGARSEKNDQLYQDVWKKSNFQGVDRLYKDGDVYLKAGVILSDITPEDTVQQNFFTATDTERKKELMRKMDNINFSMRNEVIRFASAGFLKKWRMRQDFISPRYTSRWEELKEVN